LIAYSMTIAMAEGLHHGEEIELATPLSPTADPDEDPRRCCQCCEECCCDSCRCAACCRRCRARCLCACCQHCCVCRCRRAKSQPMTWSSGLRHVVDNNVVLGCALQYRSSPNCSARWLLMLLFLTTAVFIQYAEEAMGPLCVREYLAQCPVFEFVAKHELPWPKSLRQAPPDITLPEGVVVNDRRLESSLRRLDDSVGSVLDTGDERSHGEMVRDSLLEKGASLFGSWQFDCHKPMCDIFYPQMIDWLSLWRLTNKIWGHSKSYNIPITSEAVILGYCKCEGPVYDGIVNARVTGGSRSVVVTLILQTLLPKVFRTVFVCASGSSSRKCARCNSFAIALLIALVAAMSVGVFLIKFDPAGWRKALALSAFNAAVIDPLVCFGQMLFCIRMDWPFKCCGWGPPADRLSDHARLCGHHLGADSTDEADTGDAMDSAVGVRPLRMGKAVV